MSSSIALILTSALALVAHGADVDWSLQGVVPPVKNQGLCGSSVTLAVVDALASALAIQQKPVLPKVLSLQQIRDCASEQDPCEGGSYPPQQLMDYIAKKGLCAEADYPASPKRGRCHDTCKPVLLPGTKWQMVNTANETALGVALATQPIVVALNAQPMLHYRGGIFNGTCSAELDEAMLLVGDGAGYWKVKASWGESWGIEGYGKLARGTGGAGECGIAGKPFYPQLASETGPVVV